MSNNVVGQFYTHRATQTFQLLEMAEVGGFDVYKISICGGEGPIPHFHFYTDDPNKGGCIRLDRPEYFTHGQHTEKLNSKSRKRMIEWLQSPHDSFGKFGLTSWQVICIYWDDNNRQHPFNKEAEMPNYKELR